MPVEDVFSISGRGTVVTGRVERGIVKVGEELEIVGIKPTPEDDLHGRGNVPEAPGPGPGGRQRRRAAPRHQAGRRRAGQVLAKPGSIKPHTHFTARCMCCQRTKAVVTPRSFNNYRPQFYFRTTDVTGSIELPKDKEMVMPGRQRIDHGELINPIAMEEGLRFAIREGGRTVGAGVVAKIIE